MVDLKLLELRRENDDLKSKIIRLETEMEANNSKMEQQEI